MSIPKYPNVIVELTSIDGNAFAILGAVQKAMRNSGLSEKDMTAFRDEATSGDYDHLLQTVMTYVTVE